MDKDIYDIFLNKYDSRDANYIFDLYYNLLYRFTGSILNISDTTKENILDLYCDVSKCFLLTIMSKSNNNKYPDQVEINKNIYEDISLAFFDYFDNIPITMDELKMVSLKAKIEVTNYLKKENNLYE